MIPPWAWGVGLVLVPLVVAAALAVRELAEDAARRRSALAARLLERRP